MHVSVMESTTLPYDNFSGQSISDAQVQARAELTGRQSSYMTNMILPDIVQSSKNSPLGPDCIITRDAVPDQAALVNVDLYWLISLERGCVECRVLVNDLMTGRKAMTHDPRVIITRKPRRFEAYCCSVCRQNFVTVVQALLHMKAFHRQNKKILIQDQNVFHDIDKAMEVPPVPLPWYIAKRVTEQGRPAGAETDPSSSTSLSNAQTGATDIEVNPVTMLLQAIVKEYGKQVQSVVFGKDFKDVTIQFEDATSLIAHLLNITNPDGNESTESAPSDKLEFKVQRVKSEIDGKEACIVTANNPVLAHNLIQMALKKGVAQRTGSDLVATDTANKTKGSEKSTIKEDKSVAEEKTDSPVPQIKLDRHGRPVKTVRFMLGSPDSDEDGNSSASERISGRESISPNSSVPEPEMEAQPEKSVLKQPVIQTDEKKAKEDEGLKGVVNQLISTASKGIITSVDPVSPVPTITSTSSAVSRNEILSTGAVHPLYLPKNLSVPNLSTMSVAVSVTPPSPTVTTSPATNQGMVRVQSWGGGSIPSQRFSLSTYTPTTPTNFDHMSREELRRSISVGRSFTYAEKIKLMNKLNDEDALITQKHVIGVGKRIGAEASRQGEASRSRLSSSSSAPSMSLTSTEKSNSTVVSSTSNKTKKVEPDSPTNSSSRVTHSQDGRKKRKSKYDVDQFMLAGPKEKKRRQHKIVVKDNMHSSSEGSISDKEEDGDDNPPSFLDVLRTSLAKNSYLTSQSMPNIPTSSVLSNSDYYGSGEWASAAMQALRNLQNVAGTNISASSSSRGNHESTERKQVTTDEDSDSRSSSPFVNISSSLTTAGATSITSPFVPVTAVTKTEPHPLADPIMALAQQITAERSHLKHLPNTEPENIKRSISPSSDDHEGNFVRSNQTSTSSEQPSEKPIKEKHSKRASKPHSSLVKSVDSKLIIADKGDSLEFSDTVTSSSLNEHNDMVLKFRKNSFAGSDSGVDASADSTMDMPQLFSNSVETMMKVRYVEKIGRCKVCGFSLPLSDSNASVMKSHVMEHSLKELLQTGGKQLI